MLCCVLYSTVRHCTVCVLGVGLLPVLSCTPLPTTVIHWNRRDLAYRVRSCLSLWAYYLYSPVLSTGTGPGGVLIGPRLVFGSVVSMMLDAGAGLLRFARDGVPSDEYTLTLAPQTAWLPFIGGFFFTPDFWLFLYILS